MRTKIGDSIIFINGKGTIYETTLSSVDTIKNMAIFDIKKQYIEESSSNFSDFLVCVGLMKGDKNEFSIQKCAELGATKILFFESEYCIAKMKDNKMERYNKISIEASKQSGRSTNLEIMPTIKFKQLPEILKDYDQILCAYEGGGNRININTNSSKIALIIGSEGGFSKQEIEYLKENTKTEIVTLGKNILRAETAVVTLTSIVMYLKGEI